MKSRYCMTAKTGEYVESTKRVCLVKIRKERALLFRNARISSCIQAWDDVVKTMVIYPGNVLSRTDFIKYNRVAS